MLKPYKGIKINTPYQISAKLYRKCPTHEGQDIGMVLFYHLFRETDLQVQFQANLAFVVAI